MKSLFAAVLLSVAWNLCSAKTIADAPLEFSLSVPDAAKVDIEETKKGRSVTIVYQDASTNEAFTLQAVRANNGGFSTSHELFFAGMIDGASARIDKKPSLPLRTLKYQGREFHVAQHAGVGFNSSQTLTTISFFQERGSWRKVIIVQILYNGTVAPSDDSIIEKLKAADLQPAL